MVLFEMFEFDFKTWRTPSFWKQLSHSSCSHFREERTAMDRPEVRQIPEVVQFVCHNCKSRSLKQKMYRDSVSPVKKIVFETGYLHETKSCL